MKEFNYLGNAPIKETYPEANRLTTFLKKVMFVFWKKPLILKENYIRNNVAYDFSLQKSLPTFQTLDINNTSEIIQPQNDQVHVFQW